MHHFAAFAEPFLGTLVAIPDNPRSLIAGVLASVGLLLCGPFTAVPGFLMARSILAGQASRRDRVLSRLAQGLALTACAISILLIAVFALAPAKP